MSRLETIRTNSKTADLFEGQVQHIAIVTFMAIGAFSLLVHVADSRWYYLFNSMLWAKIAIVIAIIHQVIVAVVFRLELHKNWMTNRFGDRDMQVWAGVFLPFLVARPIAILMTGLSDTTSITSMRPLEILIGVIFIGGAVVGMHSVLVYFTIPRALGGDHFRDEYAEMPLVKEGIFKYTNNGMYGVVFFGLTGIALVLGSWNALVAALFQQAYIWVHMYCTEEPDMRRIYGASEVEK